MTGNRQVGPFSCHVVPRPAPIRPLDMGGVFINYRRHDERIAFVRTLYARLTTWSGENTVFLDSAQLRRHLDRADVVVVVVHAGWAEELRTDGTDWVHNEIRWAWAGPLAALFGVHVSVVGATVEAAYRRQRWVRRNVADEVHAQIQRIQDRSPQPSVEPHDGE